MCLFLGHQTLTWQPTQIPDMFILYNLKDHLLFSEMYLGVNRASQLFLKFDMNARSLT